MKGAGSSHGTVPVDSISNMSIFGQIIKNVNHFLKILQSSGHYHLIMTIDVVIELS